MKKTLIVLLHFVTSFVIFDAIMVLTAFFYDYSASNVARCFFIGCALVGADFYLSRWILRQKGVTVKRPKLLHGIDLILPLAAGAFAVSVGLGDIPLWLQRPGDPSTSYGIALMVGVLLIEALLLAERIYLMRMNRSDRRTQT